MKYKGDVATAEAIQKEVQKSKACAFTKRTGYGGELFGEATSTLYSVKVSLADSKFMFFVSFNYRLRDDYAELYIQDKHLGRFLKLYPDVLPLFGQLKAIVLPSEQAAMVQDKYQKEQILKREATNGI